MPDMTHDELQDLWKREVLSSDLQDLDDTTLSRAVQFVSAIRVAVADADPSDTLTKRVLEQEALVSESILRDLLELRQIKILRAALSGQQPSGQMILAEEELHARVSRAIASHQDFMSDCTEGGPQAVIARPEAHGDATGSPTTENDGKMSYLLVRFLKDVDTPVVGLDGLTYGPFRENDIATIPLANARVWLRDRTVARVDIRWLERGE